MHLRDWLIKIRQIECEGLPHYIYKSLNLKGIFRKCPVETLYKRGIEVAT